MEMQLHLNQPKPFVSEKTRTLNSSSIPFNKSKINMIIFKNMEKRAKLKRYIHPASVKIGAKIFFIE